MSFSPSQRNGSGWSVCYRLWSCQYVEIKAGGRALCLVSMKRAIEAMGRDDTVQRM